MSRDRNTARPTSRRSVRRARRTPRPDPASSAVLQSSVRGQKLSVPMIQMARVGAYLLKQRLTGTKRYPLVLMLEPLFRCNLACAGCGKIDYPDADPEQAPVGRRNASRRSTNAARRWSRSPAASRCCTRRSARSSPASSRARSSSSSAPTRCSWRRSCTCSRRRPTSPSRSISTATQGDHDKSVCQDGVFDKAVEAIKAAKAKGFRVNVNATLFDGADPERMARVLRLLHGRPEARRHHHLAGLCLRAGAGPAALPQPAEDQEAVPRHLPPRQGASSGASASRRCSSTFLAGNQSTAARPGGTRRATSSAGRSPATCWAKAIVGSFKELMETTDWDSYGTGALREMRRLHGALRLRGDGRRRHRLAAVEGAEGGAVRHPHRGRDGARDRAGSGAAGRVRVRKAGRRPRWPPSHRRRTAPSSAAARPRARRATAASRARSSSPAIWRGWRQSSRANRRASMRPPRRHRPPWRPAAGRARRGR